jgi:hypothetical protein
MLRQFSTQELNELDERIARGESTFDEELIALTAHGCRHEAAAFEAALERALCRGEDPARTLEEEIEG